MDYAKQKVDEIAHACVETVLASLIEITLEKVKTECEDIMKGGSQLTEKVHNMIDISIGAFVLPKHSRLHLITKVIKHKEILIGNCWNDDKEIEKIEVTVDTKKTIENMVEWIDSLLTTTRSRLYTAYCTGIDRANKLVE
jgi:hypothetical protein